MRDDDLGGPHDRSDADAYRELRIAVALWRLRLGSCSVTVAFLMGGESIGAVFLAVGALFAVLMVAGSALGRLEVRWRSFRTERRR